MKKKKYPRVTVCWWDTTADHIDFDPEKEIYYPSYRETPGLLVRNEKYENFITLCRESGEDDGEVNYRDPCSIPKGVIIEIKKRRG